MRHIYFSVGIIVALAAGFFGLSSAFSSRQVPIKSIPVPISSASVSLALSSTSPRVALAMGISDIVPGQSITREVTVTNTGTVALAEIYFRVSTSGNSPLFSPGGIQLIVSRCLAAPTKAPHPFSCPTVTTVAAHPLGEYDTPTAIAGNIARGSSVYLIFTLSLPVSAGDVYASQTAGLSWQFEAVS